MTAMAPRKLALVWLSSFAFACNDPGTGTEGSASATAGTTTGRPPTDSTGHTGNDATQGMTGSHDGTSTSTSGADSTTVSVDGTTMPPIKLDLGGIPDSPEFCT